MKRPRTLLSAVLVASFALLAVAGCSANTPTADVFSPSDGILDTGFWENITALDHVKLCEYVGIPIPNDVYEVSDESVQTEVDTILAEYASKEQITDRAVVDGDTVNIDYVGRVDGVEFDGGSTGGQGTEVTMESQAMLMTSLSRLLGINPANHLMLR